MSAHDEPCTVTVDFGDEVPVAVFCIADEPVPVEGAAPSGLVFSTPTNSGYLGAI